MFSREIKEKNEYRVFTNLLIHKNECSLFYTNFFSKNNVSSSISPIKDKLIFLTCFYPHHILVITANWPLLKMRNGSELSRMLASSVYQVCLVERLYIFFLVTLKYKLVLSQISVHAHSGLEMWIREKGSFWVRKMNNWNVSMVTFWGLWVWRRCLCVDSWL